MMMLLFLLGNLPTVNSAIYKTQTGEIPAEDSTKRIVFIVGFFPIGNSLVIDELSFTEAPADRHCTG